MNNRNKKQIDRRNAVKGIGSIVAVSTLPVAGLPGLVYAGPTSSGNAGDDIDTYLSASAALLGVEQDVLGPPIQQDGDPLQEMYYTVCSSANLSATDDFLNQYLAYEGTGMSDQDIADALLRNNAGSATSGPRDDSVGAIARLTMQMWLFGVWYGGTEIANVANSANWIDGPWANDFVVSAAAYKAGWIWRFAQAHPMGFSHYNFGSWADNPPPLSDFLTAMG